MKAISRSVYNVVETEVGQTWQTQKGGGSQQARARGCRWYLRVGELGHENAVFINNDF